MARPLVERRLANRISSRTNKLKVKYGLTPLAFDNMLDAQGGRCAICRGTQEQRLSVDHDHGTGKVRALLCKRCNTGLGQFGDDWALLQRAAEYLKGHL